MENLRKINENMWEISMQGEMNVPGIIFASKKLLLDMKKDKTLEQIKNVAKLKGAHHYLGRERKKN